MKAKAKTVNFYLHTHWDREWYWGFERYRTQLIAVLKQVIEGLEDGSLPSFHLDGQACALDDFLAVEPDYLSRVKSLVKDEQLFVGPWYVLNDQMLVGGESMIRNLEYGLERSRRYGNPMMVGYCPDTFGHSQDLPRILRGFGIDTAIVWRGVPELDNGPEFVWQSPDGSEVLAVLFAKGYHQTFIHEAERKGNGAGINDIIRTLDGWLDSEVYSRNIDAVLVPVGGDHVGPPRDMKAILKQLKSQLKSHLKSDPRSQLKSQLKPDLKSKAKSKLTPTSNDAPHAVLAKCVCLSDYLSELKKRSDESDGPVRFIQGELRDNSSALEHAAGYMLFGVLSSRLYLKRQNRLAEHRLARISEPLYSIASLLDLIEYPQKEMENAWRHLLHNQPHDSICGCSIDAVHREMLPRYASIHEILDVLDRRVREVLLLTDETGTASVGREHLDLADPDIELAAIAVFNLSCEELSTPVRVRLALPQKKEKDKAKTASSSSGANQEKATDAIADAMADGIAAGADYLRTILPQGTDFQIESISEATELFGATGDPPEYKNVDFIDCWIEAPSIPAMGVGFIPLNNGQKHGSKRKASHSAKTATVKTGRGISNTDRVSDRNRAIGNPAPCLVTNKKLSNGLFTVSVEDDGDLVVAAGSGSAQKQYRLGHIISDIADAGDSYNFDPILDDQPVYARLKSVSECSHGPLCASLKLTYEIDLPIGIEECGPPPKPMKDMENLCFFRRSSETRKHEIVTTVSLKKGVPIVFFHTEWNNQSADHRLQVSFKTGARVKTTWSENHMSLVKRKVGKAQVNLPAPRYTEAPLDRFPAQRFFVANEQVFLNTGLPEYGVDADKVEITILRAFSMLSRKRLLTRGGGAGPYMEVPDGNCIGRNVVTYGWAPLAGFDASSGFAQSNVAASNLFDAVPFDAMEADFDAVGEAHEKSSTPWVPYAYRLAELFEGSHWSTPVTREGMTLIQEALHEGNTPDSRSVLSIDNEKIIRTAFYSKDDGDSFLLRLLNTTGDVQGAKLRINDDDLSVRKVNLDGKHLGKVLKPVEEQDGSAVYDIQFGVNELITLRLKRRGT